MERANIPRKVIVSITINVLLRVASGRLLSESGGGSEQEETWEPLYNLNSLGYSPAVGNSTDSYREPNLLNPLTVVRFKNVDCTSSANFMTGTCYTVLGCLSGVSLFHASVHAAGSCMKGFGMCCTSILGCGGSSRNNNTWLQSPGYPNSFNSGQDCQQTIDIEENICQLRLDIGDLTLDVPDTTGTCSTDYLTVNQDTKFDRLCGVTKNNHFYLDVDYSSNSKVIFSFHTDSSTSYDRTWSIRVSKICCDSLEEVPRGCGQYYTGTTGIIKSLNYEAPSSGDNIISKLNYGICIRMELGYCKNTYTEDKTDGWLPICGDIFERPGRYDAQVVPTVAAKCHTAGAINPIPATWTHSYTSPHTFKLDTTRDTTNTHPSTIAANQDGVYYYSYSQTAC